MDFQDYNLFTDNKNHPPQEQSKRDLPQWIREELFSSSARGANSQLRGRDAKSRRTVKGGEGRDFP